MNPRPKSFLNLAAVTLVILLIGAITGWFCAPMPIEDIDSLTYCACGYSTVRFNDGKITMVSYFHPTVKPGQLIGTYRVVGDKVELDISFKGQVHHNTFVRNNIGLINPPGAQFPYRYCALNGRSLKTYINCAVLRFRSEVNELWERV